LQVDLVREEELPRRCAIQSGGAMV
jgi:hypothetical protein